MSGDRPRTLVADRVPEMPAQAWGDPGRAHELSDAVRALIADALGTELAPRPPVDPAAIPLPGPALDDGALQALRTALGADGVSTEKADRLRHTAGKSTPDLLRMRGGQVDAAPDAVLRPAGHDGVAAALRICAEHAVAVVPFGGGTSVVGGVAPLRGRFSAVAALDLRRLDALDELDTAAHTAVLGAGLRGPEAEHLLNERGFTLGHLPQSFEFATIGGFAATRSSGQASAGYGRFDDMVVALTAATPQGTLHAGRGVPSAAGPDLRALLLGSEGVFGVITSVTVRVRPLPEAAVDEAWRFDDYPTGAAALRRLAQSGLRPTVARLSDATETFVNAALAGSAAPAGCLAVLGFDGPAGEVAARRAAAARTLEQSGGEPLGPEPVAHWREGRFNAPYLRDALLSAGVLAETLETAAPWSSLLPLYEAVGSALSTALDGPDGRAIVLCHISHTYPEGASLYFTVAAPAGNDPLERWARAKRAAGDAIAAGGGTITHHHAVGTDHRPWMAAEIGPLGAAALRAVKSALDPEGILNPGKLIPDTD